MPELGEYLKRIGFNGVPRPDGETLRALHRHHLLAIPYENLDVQLGVPVGLDIDGIYRKLVLEHRGGWCYEMNGLLAWALQEIGFHVTRLAAGVMREARGEAAVGNHLAVRVRLNDGPWLADVGFGDGLLEPVPVAPARIRQRHFDFTLERLDDGWWRLHNHPHGSARSFDFGEDPADPHVLERQCRLLQTSPQSPFTQVAVVQRHVPDGLAVLRGRVLTRVRASGLSRAEIADRAGYATVLREVFDLEPVGLDALWDRVESQHADYVARLATPPQPAGG